MDISSLSVIMCEGISLFPFFVSSANGRLAIATFPR
jgi:hypothetical protein